MAEDLPPVEVTGRRRGGGFGVDSVHFHEFSCSESEGVGEELERWTLPWRSCLWRDHRIEEAVGASASGRPGFLQPPFQKLIARDLPNNEWRFLHIFRVPILQSW
ncbi:uncharacterized protein [Lolium perenne]|uniref:uncharacterized protein n=1 Tax=Lolium perenne TaxID=4522 RepID=UPI003A99AA27